MNGIIAGKESQIREIETRISELKQEGKNLSKKDILALKDLESGRILWASKLKALGQIIPHDMALTSLKFSETYLLISGISRIYRDEREFDVIEEFIDRLRGDETFAADFSEIKFSQFSRLTIMNQDIITFEIRADLRVPEKLSKKSGRRS
jgi:Tfp pilus assembly protein PilN